MNKNDRDEMIKKADQKLSDAAAMVARAAQDLSGSADADTKYPIYRVHADEMGALREALAAWAQASEEMVEAIREAETVTLAELPHVLAVRPQDAGNLRITLDPAAPEPDPAKRALRLVLAIADHPHLDNVDADGVRSGGAERSRELGLDYVVLAPKTREQIERAIGDEPCCAHHAGGGANWQACGEGVTAHDRHAVAAEAGARHGTVPEELLSAVTLPSAPPNLLSLAQVRDLLTCALEGGSNYWYTIEHFVEPDGDPAVVEYRHIEYPTMPGGALLIRAEGHDNPMRTDGLWQLDLAACARGAETMRDKYPRHFGDAVGESEDAETGDVFLQCALFGEVVFG